MKYLKALKRDQSGIASIIIVILIILVLTLIALAMARNANREQRQALDRQLSAQANYAAESGVNDTVEYIRTHLNDASFSKKKDKCDQNPSLSDLSGGSSEGRVGSDPGVKYTCVLYDLQPIDIVIDNVSGDNPVIVPIQNAGGSGVKSITITWSNPSEGKDVSGCPGVTGGSLPNSFGSNCNVGILRAELINSTVLKREEMIKSDFTAYLYPTNNATPGSTSRTGNVGQDNGVFLNGGCSNGECKATIDGLGVSGEGQLYLRMSTLYKKKSKVVITGVDNNDQPVMFKNAQMMIDVTGKASDVLKRIQVRKAVNPTTNQSGSAVKITGGGGDSFCKLLDVYPGQTSSPDNCH